MSFSRIGKRMMGAIITASMVFSLIPGMMLFADTNYQINNTVADVISLSITKDGADVTSASSGSTITVSVNGTSYAGGDGWTVSGSGANRRREILVDGLAVRKADGTSAATLTPVSGRAGTWTFTMPDSDVYITFPELNTSETITVPNNTAVFRSGLGNGGDYTFSTTKTGDGDPYGYLAYSSGSGYTRICNDDSAGNLNFRLPDSGSVTIPGGSFFHLGYGLYSDSATGNYTAQGTSGSVTIQFDSVTKQAQTISVDDVSLSMGTTGSTIGATITTGDGTLTYSVTSGSDVIQVDTDTGAITTLATGTATVQIVASETATYRRTTRNIRVTVTEPAPGTIAATVAGFTGEYDGSAHGATITVTDPSAGATVMFGTSDGTYDLTESPTYTAVGTYTVYYKITATGYTDMTGSVTITITEPAPAPQPEPAPAPQPDPEPAPQPDPAPAAPSSAPAGPTPEQIRAQLISNFVERLYIVALDRSYDVVGRDYWVDQLMNQGNSGSYVAKGFFHSQEFLARDLSDEEFVTVLYSVFFDRTPDAEGFANWTNALANGATRDQVIAGFAGSPEWAATCARFAVNI